MATPVRRQPDETVNWSASVPFILAHFVPLAAFVTGVTARAVILAVVLYVVRVFFITAGYHRYFAHRSYRLGRVAQFLMAFGGTTAAQKGPLWWAGTHRDHHRYADTARDPHSPLKGFWWSHVGWVLSSSADESDEERIADFARYPELRFLDRYDWIGPWALAVAAYFVAGWSGVVIGFFASTVVLWHATFMVNSVAHVFGTRPYGTADTSRNNPVVALLTLGEGWHNNHHHYPASARQGFRWWEVDVAYYVLRGLRLVGVVRDLREPPVKAREARRVRSGHLDVGSLRYHLDRATATLERAGSRLPPAELDRLRSMLAEAGDRARRLSRDRPRRTTPG